MALEDLDDDYLEVEKKFHSEELNLLINNLSGIFLEDIDFETMLKGYFTEAGWQDVLVLIEKKLKSAICSICSLQCRDKCKQCKLCEQWFHFNCQNITKYFQQSTSNNWKCTNCK